MRRDATPERIAERFWAKVDKSGSCWLWMAAKDPDGYGLFRRGPRAHRVAWEMAHGAIPPGLLVRHSCDAPACVNPAHLLLGTTQDNIADKVSRCRQPRGVTQAKAKLTDDAVRTIRASPLPQRALAKIYGVSQPAIGYAKRGDTWGHVHG